MRGGHLAALVLASALLPVAGHAQPRPTAAVTLVSIDGRTAADVPTLPARVARLLVRCQARLEQAGGSAAIDVQLTLDARGHAGSIHTSFPGIAAPTPQQRRLQSCVVRALEILHLGNGPRASAQIQIRWGVEPAMPAPAPEHPTPAPDQPTPAPAPEPVRP